MKKYVYFLILGGLTAGLFSSCHDDDKYIPTPPVVTIENLSGTSAMPQGDSIVLKAKVESPLATTLSWSVAGEGTSTDSVYVFKADELGNYEVKLTATNADGEVSATASLEVYGKYKYGTFILNEGVSSKDVCSKLEFISPKGILTDSVYQKENNGEQLKLLCQDLFISNNKIYFISQRNALIVANAETLKKEIVYEEELQNLKSPSHLVVLDEDDIYIRDNAGVYLFKPSDKSMTLIEGTSKARKNTMALVDGKVFVSKSNTVVVIEKGKKEISYTIEFDGNVSGVVKSSDNNLWVSDASGKISKINVSDYSVIQANELEEDVKSLLTASYAAAPSITAKGDTLYVSALKSKIYRHIFSKNQTDFIVDASTMVENVNIVYNTVAVNPVNGDLILNSIKGYGDNIAVNNISVFNFNGGEAVLKANYENYLRYPAGTFFTYNFE